MTHVLGGQDDPLTKFTVSELKPYTKYGFNISAGTVVGFGPPALVVVTTRETAPSGPPADIQVANFTHNEMNITWSPPDPSKRNGVITKYSLCIRNQTYGFCLHEDTFEFTQTSYTFSGLRPYRVYSVTIRAATVKGFGPIGSITRRTAQSEPDGPPMEKIVKYLDESTISFSWTEPHPELHNGIIIYYHVCIRKYGPDFSCARTAQIPRQNEKSYAYGGLSPSSEYVVVIRAATIIGLGPAAFIQKTA
ncbi:phosphatidylinositol phosphatase PTPRQ-like, partial [Paramuricea clavata]